MRKEEEEEEENGRSERDTVPTCLTAVRDCKSRNSTCHTKSVSGLSKFLVFADCYDADFDYCSRCRKDYCDTRRTM
jgi:hypothetical protein